MEKSKMREIAEEWLKEKGFSKKPLENLSIEEVGLIIHDLQVHQIELEMQNEELKRIQNELDQSKARYFELFDLAPEGYVVISEKGLILETNLTAANMIGLERAQLFGQRLSQFIYREDSDVFYLHRNKLYETKENQECDLRIIKKDGTLFWGHIKAVFVTKEGLNFCRLILSDISKRMNALSKLEESEEKYRLVYSSMSQGMALHEIITDNSGKPIDYVYLDINNSYEALLHVKREDVIGKRITEVMPKVEPYWIETFGNVALTGVPMEYENYLETTGRYYNTYTYRTKHGQFAVLATDITERKQVLEQLKQKEKNLLETQRIAHVGTWRLNVKTNEVVWTEELYKMYGFDPTLPPPPYTEHMKLFTPESWEVLSRSLALTSSQGIPYELELETVTKEGSNGWMWVRGEAEKDIDGKIIAIWGAAQDITDRKRREEELFLANKHLEDSEKRYRLLNDNLDVGVVVHNADTSIKYCNQRAATLLGLSYDVLLGSYASSNHFEFVNGNSKKLLIDEYPVNSIINNDGPIRDYIIGINHRNDKLVWVKVNGLPMKNVDGSIHEIVISFGDITLEKESQDKIIHVNNHDFLTGLYNRRYFVESYRKMDNPQFYPLGILMLDVNGLKIMNDAFGHAIGDIALKNVSKILQSSCRENDIICRIGGDEFAVILPNVTQGELESIKINIQEASINEKVNNIEISLASGYEIKDINIVGDLDDILKLAENHMYRHKLADNISVRNNAIKAILKTLTEKYEKERIHSERVSRLCKGMGEALDLGVDDVKELEMAGMYHDIGKISIPDAILDKPGRLTDEDYKIIKTHPEVSYQILRAADEYSDLAIHALHHHERWDGKGYPSGLKGDSIPLFSRIICIIDAFEAMTAVRSYKKQMSQDEAVKEIIMCSGSQFDEKMARVFVEKVLHKEWKT